MPVKVTQDHLTAVSTAFRKLADRQVMVGVPSTRAGRDPEPGSTEEVNNAEIAYWMEFGVPEENIPARPFLGPGIRAAQEKVIGRFKQAASLALSGQTSGAESALEAAGIAAVAAVQNQIRSGDFVPLSPYTIEQRHRKRNRTKAWIAQHGQDDKPLIDTGQLIQAITYVVRSRRGD
jgi:hypothetical protein